MRLPLSLSIHQRLSLALGLLVALTFSAMLIGVWLEAGPRQHSEIASTMRVTESLVRSSLATLEDSAAPAENLARFTDSLRHLRHVRIELASRIANSEPGAAASIAIPVVIGDRTIDTIVLTPTTADEMSEVRQTLSRIALYGVVFGFGALVLTSVMVARLLAPLTGLGRALRLLEDGDTRVTLSTEGPPELSAIAGRVNALAHALERARSDNRRLSAAIVRAQDDERREIARELHDELGPHLFTIQAGALALSRDIEHSARPLDVDGRVPLTAHTREIISQIDALQATNRRVLERLSPVGLADLGLEGSLRARVAKLARSAPDVAVRIEIDATLDDLDETTSLTVYRVVQEGVFNALRHAGARTVIIRIDEDPGTRDGLEDDALTIDVRDDGEGLPADVMPGHGLTGMRGRVNALGGTLSIKDAADGGTVLRAIVPVTRVGTKAASGAGDRGLTE